MRKKKIHILLGVLCCAGCSVVDNGSAGKLAHLGPVIVVDSPPGHGHKDVVSREVSQIGIWLDLDASDQVTGAGVGYRANTLLSLPEECRLVFITKGNEQFEQATLFAHELLKDGELCISDQ